MYEKKGRIMKLKLSIVLSVFLLSGCQNPQNIKPSNGFLGLTSDPDEVDFKEKPNLNNSNIPITSADKTYYSALGSWCVSSIDKGLFCTTPGSGYMTKVKEIK